MKYSPKIDGLRFVAIALVLLEHFGNKLGGFISAGYYGVNLFFVISGFLITTILISSKNSFGGGIKIIHDCTDLGHVLVSIPTGAG